MSDVEGTVLANRSKLLSKAWFPMHNCACGVGVGLGCERGVAVAKGEQNKL